MQLIELIKTNEEISKNCLKKYSSAEINYQDKDGDTPLHWAIRLNKRNFINNLLNNKYINVNIQNKIKVTPLIEAIINNDDQTTTLLINPAVKSKSIFWKNIDGQDALMLLIKNRNWTMAKIVFKKIALIINNPNYARYLFSQVLNEHQWDFVDLMLKLTTYELITTNGIEIILSCAAKEKQWDFIERMLKKINIWKFNFDSFQAVITLATLEKKWVIVNELINKVDSKAKLNLNNIEDLFSLIFQSKKWEICSKLIDKISFKLVSLELFNSIAIETINNGQWYIVHQLLDKVLNDKANEINYKFNHMPLCLAIILKEEEIAMNLILEMPLDQLLLNSKYGLLTLRLTSLNNMNNIAYNIIERLPFNNINFQDDNGETFLHWALKYSKLDFIKMMKVASKSDIDFNIKNQKGESIGSLLNDETSEIFKVGKIRDNYIEFNFENLDDENISNNWKAIKIILLELNEIINQIDKIVNGSEIINKIITLAINEQAITFIQENILNTNNELLKQKLELYCNNLVKIINLKTKAMSADDKKIYLENELSSEVGKLKKSQKIESKQTENLNINFKQNVSFKNKKRVVSTPSKSNSFIDNKKNASVNEKPKNSGFTNGAKLKKNRIFNHRYEQDNIDQITKSIIFLEKQQSLINNEKSKKTNDDINKIKNNSSILIGCHSLSNYDTLVQLQRQSDDIEQQRFLVANNILSSIYMISRGSDVDHEKGRPAIIIGKDIKNDRETLVLVGTTKTKDDDNFTKIFQLQLNNSNPETNFYDNGFKWVNSNYIDGKWDTTIKLNINQKQLITKFLSIDQLTKLTKKL